MGVKIKITLVFLLAISVSGQDLVDEKETISDVDNKIEAVENVEVSVDKETAPVEVISDTGLQVRNGKYQMLDDTVEGAVSDLTDIAIDTNNEQNERQILMPSTTAPTNNEFGEF